MYRSFLSSWKIIVEMSQ